MKRPAAYPFTLLFILILLFSATSCHGRKVRNELLEFARTVESLSGRNQILTQQVNDLETLQATKGPEAILARLNGLIADIDSMMAPIKALEVQTEEIQSLKGQYLRTWESMRDALALIARVIQTRDEKLAMTMDSQLESRMMVYEQTGEAFEVNYKQLIAQYNITKEELGLPGLPTVPTATSPTAPAQ